MKALESIWGTSAKYLALDDREVGFHLIKPTAMRCTTFSVAGNSIWEIPANKICVLQL